MKKKQKKLCNMKKILAIIASLAMVFASCNKMKPEMGENGDNENKGITLNLTINAPSNDDTKAYIKTGWVDGDQLFIWFDTNTGEKPDMVIKKNGKSWEQDISAEVSGNTPAASGYMKVLYNNILAVTAKDQYEFADNTLSGRIQTWTFLTEIQVVVRNLEAADAGKYALSCDKFTTYKGHVVGADAITAAPAGAAGSFVNGISNADGVAFVYASSTAYDTITDLRFTLNEGDGTGDLPIITPTEPEYVEIAGLKWAKWNLGASKPEESGYYFQWGDTGGSVYSTPLTYTAEKKNIAKKVTRIKGIIIDRGNFGTLQTAEWINTKTGPTKMDWEHAPFNNGSSTFNQEYFNTVKSSVCPNNILAPEYDAAHTYLGGQWRMPTYNEFKELVNQTNNEWVENYEGTGIQGRLFTSKEDPSKCVFFPAAGQGSGTVHQYLSICYYWTSTLSSGEYACYLNSDKTATMSGVYISFRHVGCPIRPVSD